MLHAITLDGTTASCAPCRTSYTDPNDLVRAMWVVGHVGIPVRPRALRAPGCHSVCIGEDHCLTEGDRGGD